MITLNPQQIEQQTQLLYLAERNRNQLSATTFFRSKTNYCIIAIVECGLRIAEYKVLIINDSTIHIPQSEIHNPKL